VGFDVVTVELADKEPVLEVVGLGKSFAGHQALDGVSLTVRRGEVVALLGQNGSGKSTLVKILANVHRPDVGVVRVGGVEGSGSGALHFIHQDLGLISELSTVENLSLDPSNSAPILLPIRRRHESRRAKKLVERYGEGFDVHQPVGRLTPAQQAIVAIARAMNGWAEGDNVLILDEPTASLQGDEVQALLAAIREVARAGTSVLFISHRLEEVTELADRVVVLRDGRKVHDVSATGLDATSLATLITGRELEGSNVLHPVSGTADPVLVVQALGGMGVKELDLEISPGEVLGVAGGLGSGRERVAGLIFGAYPDRHGEVHVDGRKIPPGRPHGAQKLGLSLVPGDRHQRGGVLAHSVRENLVLPRLADLLRLRVHLRRHLEVREAAGWAQQVELRPMQPERPLGLLSGGNQQKVVIARSLRLAPRVLVLEDPTQGVDVGAAAGIRQLVLEAARAGTAVLVCSSDNTDLVEMCERVLVLREGQLVAELRGDEINDHRLTVESLGGEVALESASSSSIGARQHRAS
jgi:ABC-type sugar transport system ATPase subunit